MKDLFISNGNIKVQASIFNLPCKKTCKPGLACRKFCYAQKSEKMYPQVKPCRENNLKVSKSSLFVTLMVKMIKRKKDVKFFRFLESGDFYSKEFVLKCYEVCKQLPNIKFYGYTKREDIFTKELLDLKPSNFTLSFSIDEIQTNEKIKYEVPYGYDNVTIVHATKTSCNAQTKDNVKCMKNCFKCVLKKKDTIIFKKH